MKSVVKNYLQAQGIKRNDEEYQEIATRYANFQEEKGSFKGLKEANIILRYAHKGSETE